MLILVLLGLGGYGLYRLVTSDERATPAPAPPPPVPQPVATVPRKVGLALDSIRRDLADLKTRAAKAAIQSQAFRDGFNKGAQATAERLAPVRVPMPMRDLSREALDDAFAKDVAMPGDDDTDEGVVEFGGSVAEED